jgi:hypothetical protein
MSSHLAFLSVSNPRNLDKSRHFTVHLFRPWRTGSARSIDGGPRFFTKVLPTPHAYSDRWTVKTKRARARSCASVVTRKRPSLNRALRTQASWREKRRTSTFSYFFLPNARSVAGELVLIEAGPGRGFLNRPASANAGRIGSGGVALRASTPATRGL